MNLLTAILQHAHKEPDAVAVVGPDGTCTYRQLLIRAARYANSYEGNGVRPGDRVAVVLPPGKEALAAYIGAFFARAAYVPIAPGQAPVRAMKMLENCTPKLSVGLPVPGWEDAVLRTPASLAGRSWPSPRTRLPVPDPAVGASDDVAYVMHTSGSTGFPKGVEIEHAGVGNLLADLDRRAPLNPGHVGCWWASPEFDASIMECWGPLCGGGTVAVMPEADRWEGRRFAAFLDRHAVSSAFVPPSYLADVHDHLQSDRDSCPGLHKVITGAGPVRLGLLQDLMRARPELVIINAYGPAEATVCATLYTVPATGGDPASRTPIGRAVRGLTVTVAGADGSASPDGGAGELVVSGPGVGRGYLGPGGDADRRFVIPPPGQPGVRSYRTGDRVQLLADGELLFLGRADRQLKVRGYRIEPAEVEKAIRAVARVREVIVDQRAVPGRGDLVVAYVVPDGRLPDPKGLRRALQPLLPAWAIPAFFIPLPTLPLTSNGKVDQEVLARLPLTVGGAGKVNGEPYRPGQELRAVLAAWRTEFGDAVRDDIGFMELGGSSLPAVRVANALRVATGREVLVADVLTAPSARDLAVLLGAAGRLEDAPDFPLAGALESGLSPAQQGLWMDDLIDGTGLAYVEPLAYLLPRQVDIDRLSSAFSRAVSAHPALGATTRRTGGEVRLLLVRHQIPLERPTGADERSLIKPFDVDGGPLMRAGVLPVADGRDLLVLVWHHLVTDGWSVRLFLSCLERCYADPAYVPETPALTLCDANVRLSRQAGSPETAAAVETALSYLDGVRFPPARRSVSGHGRISAVRLGPSLSGRLLAACRETGLTVSAYLLTAYQYALARFLDLDGSVLGCAVAGRDQPDYQNIIGYFTNTVLVRVRDQCVTPTTHVVRRVEAGFRQARMLQEGVPLGQLVAAWRQRRLDLPRRVLRILFSLDEGYDLSLGGMRCESWPISMERTMFGASLVLHQSSDGIRGEFQHALDLLDETAAAGIVDTIIEVVEHLV